MDVGALTEITLGSGDLATVAGAGAAAMIVAQFCKRLLNLTIAMTRSVAMLAGLLVVVIATVLNTNETDAIQLVLAVLVGMQAGLSASALFDNVKEGMAHQTFPAETIADPSVGLAVVGSDETDDLPSKVEAFGLPPEDEAEDTSPETENTTPVE